MDRSVGTFGLSGHLKVHAGSRPYATEEVKNMSSSDYAALVCTMSWWDGDLARCRWCMTPLTGRQQRWCGPQCPWLWNINHAWSNARRARVERDRECVRCGSTKRLEVNHIEPRNGAGYGPGCHHHQTNLETLCHDHHVKVTNAQRLARR